MDWNIVVEMLSYGLGAGLACVVAAFILVLGLAIIFGILELFDRWRLRRK